MTRPAKRGPLLIVGGTEAPCEGSDILGRFVELAGGPDAPIAVLTAASTIPQQVWRDYRAGFEKAGARHCVHVRVDDRANAADETTVAAVGAARGIFISGGDQKRLMAHVGGTPLHEALRTAVLERGACLAGTSAGASALGVHMVTDGRAEFSPEKGAVGMAAGLGVVPHCVLDQHFSQRHRINRLLTLVAADPGLTGIGIDEDTGLLLAPDGAVEVIGAGAVTIVDGRHMQSNLAEIDEGGMPTMLDVRVHVLQSGTTYETLPPVLMPVLQPIFPR
ncbi:cyanophycinase [Pseudoduganella plicata]|uniref:Cyanophycinase n=1 Tax=Pseudoduganella plicata TaxID=321984 RepID=A0AA87YCS4_9BURK|nr:cyanophycinase [Pseudoduganella plicata]GGY89670.1 cyanophycinase [Pseudoduganella plicata]